MKKLSIIEMFFSKQVKKIEKQENETLADQIKMIEVSTDAIEFCQLQIMKSLKLLKPCEN